MDAFKEYKVTITKEELAALPAASFEGNIHIIDSEDAAVAATEILGAEKVIGFDTETKPSFKRGQTNNVALLQLSTHSDCFLFRLNKIGLCQQVKTLLENPEIVKVGVSIHDDFHNLRKLYSLIPDGFIDLQSYVKQFRITDNSLSRIFGILFGCRISKGQRLTNWEAAELSPSQQHYAALDAFACIKIYDLLNSGTFDPEKSPYFREIPVDTHPNKSETDTTS